MNLDTFAGHLKLSDNCRKVLTLFVYPLMAVFSLCLVFFYYCAFKANAIGLPVLLLSVLPLIVCMFVGVLLLIKEQHNPATCFVVIGVPAVTAFGLFMLPANVPDEASHIWQAAALLSRNSNGFDVISCFQVGQFPSSYADYFNAMTQHTDWSSVFVCYTYLGSYYPHLYFIPGVILGFAQQMGFNAFVALSVSRVCAGLVYCFAAHWIIKLMPVGKNAVLIFLLNPILLQQEASVSADSVANIVAILYVAVVVKVYADSLYSYRSLLALTLLSVLLLLSKIMFFPLVLLNLIHWKILKGKDSYTKFICSFFGIALVAGCAFVYLYHGSFMPDSFDLMRAPLHCTKVFIKSIWEMGPFWFQSYAGYNLGALSINVWPFCFWLYIIVQSVVLFYNDENNEKLFCCTDRFAIITVVFVNFFLIVMTMRNWTLTVDKREDIIMGVQGRYLFPLVLPVLLNILRPIKSSSEGHALLGSSLIMSTILLVDFISILSAF